MADLVVSSNQAHQQASFQDASGSKDQSISAKTGLQGKSITVNSPEQQGKLQQAKQIFSRIVSSLSHGIEFIAQKFKRAEVPTNIDPSLKPHPGDVGRELMSAKVNQVHGLSLPQMAPVILKPESLKPEVMDASSTSSPDPTGLTPRQQQLLDDANAKYQEALVEHTKARAANSYAKEAKEESHDARKKVEARTEAVQMKKEKGSKDLYAQPSQTLQKIDAVQARKGDINASGLGELPPKMPDSPSPDVRGAAVEKDTTEAAPPPKPARSPAAERKDEAPPKPARSPKVERNTVEQKSEQSDVAKTQEPPPKPARAKRTENNAQAEKASAPDAPPPKPKRHGGVQTVTNQQFDDIRKERADPFTRV